VLFALCSVARKHDVDPEAALRGTLDRFTARVRVAEALARERGQDLSVLDAAALDGLWHEAKAKTAKSQE
jgi:ATP diphosphatase